MPVVPSPSSWRRAEHSACKAPSVHRGEGARQTLAPTSRFNPSGETHVVLDAEFGGDEGEVHRSRSTGEVAQPPGSLLVSPEMSESGWVADESGTEKWLAAQDWLDVAHALTEERSPTRG